MVVWTVPGHITIAAMPYRQLSPDQQARVAEILKSHPDYEKWVQSYSQAGESNPDLAAFIFMRASTWPDEIRRAAGKGSRQCDHSHWHYVDYPLKPPAFPIE